MEVILVSLVVSLIVNILMPKRLENKQVDSNSNDSYKNVGIGVPVPEPGKVKPPLKKN